MAPVSEMSYALPSNASPEPTGSSSPVKVQVMVSPARAGNPARSPSRSTVAAHISVEGSATCETPAGRVSVIVMGAPPVLTETEGPALRGAMRQAIASPAVMPDSGVARSSSVLEISRSARGTTVIVSSSHPGAAGEAGAGDSGDAAHASFVTAVRVPISAVTRAESCSWGAEAPGSTVPAYAATTAVVPSAPGVAPVTLHPSPAALPSM